MQKDRDKKRIQDFGGKPEGQTLLRRPRSPSKDNIKNGSSRNRMGQSGVDFFGSW
jgi:hypothetical protein